MILIRDALRLAVTKLKIRKIRLTVTVVIASLLFAGAVFAVTVVNGSLKSFKTFNVSGLSNKYLVVGSPGQSLDYTDPGLIAFIEAEEKAINIRKKAEAKRLGIEFTPTVELQWVQSDPSGGKYVNMGLSEVQKLISTYYEKSNLSTSFSSFTKFVTDNGAVNAYRASSEYQPNISGDTKSVLVDGKENYVKQENVDPYTVRGFKTIESNPVRVIDDDLITPFLLPDQTFTSTGSGNYPVLVPFSVAQEALGLKALPDNATSNEKIQRVKQVRSGVAGKTLSVCYRNQISSQSIQNTVQQKQDIELNKNNKNYVKPSVLFDLPATACGEVIVTKDSRTADEKKATAKQDEFDRIFGKQPATSRIVTFRIAGITPDPDNGFTSSIVGILSSIARTSVGSGWVLPSSLAKDPALSGIVADLYNPADPSTQFIAKLPDGATLKRFVKDLSCNKDMSMLAANATNKACDEQQKFFVFYNFGNNVVAIDEFQSGFNKFFNIVLIVIAIISSVIMMGTIARIIADSRRETAVFRAIGATRLDMTLVYGLYASMMATLVVVSALSLGWIAAGIFNNHYTQQVTAEAILVFNVSDLGKKFTFYALDFAKILRIAGVVILASLLGLVLPLLANLRRSPLKDMRDEN
jgi:hypothetical protein